LSERRCAWLACTLRRSPEAASFRPRAHYHHASAYNCQACWDLEKPFGERSGGGATDEVESIPTRKAREISVAPPCDECLKRVERSPSHRLVNAS
jgi:hypothetical protein